MSESKDRAEEIGEIKKQEEQRQAMLDEYARRQKEADERLAKLVATPLSKDDAERKFSDNKIEALKLTVIRQKWAAQIDVLQDEITKVRKQITDVDSRLTALQLDDAITFRRTLNPVDGKTEKAPAMGTPVGPETK